MISEERVKELYNRPRRYGTWVNISGVPAFLARKALYGYRGMRELQAADRGLKPGSSVLLMCCAICQELDLFVERIGKDAYVLGLDFSPNLLAEARARIETLGMTNVELREANVATELNLDRQFDVVSCTGGMSVITNWQSAYKNLLEAVRVGGTILISDVSFRDGWRKVLNPLLTWSTKEFGGDSEGLSHFNLVVKRMQSDPNLTDVELTVRGHYGFIRATRSR